MMTKETKITLAMVETLGMANAILFYIKAGAGRRCQSKRGFPTLLSDLVRSLWYLKKPHTSEELNALNTLCAQVNSGNLEAIQEFQQRYLVAPSRDGEEDRISAYASMFVRVTCAQGKVYLDLEGKNPALIASFGKAALGDLSALNALLELERGPRKDNKTWIGSSPKQTKAKPPHGAYWN